MFIRFILLLTLLVAVRGEETASRLNPLLLDPRYPVMSDWAKAGVAGDIPHNLKVIAHARPGADLQQLIDEAPEKGGVIVLSGGDFPLTSPLKMRSHVVLRGAETSQTHLVIKLRAQKNTGTEPNGNSSMIAAVQFNGTTRAGLELLAVVFDPTVPAPPVASDDEVDLRDNHDDLDDLHVMSIRFTDAIDCWMNNCRIINSGSHPLFIEGSRQLSFVYVDIKGAHNRGPDSGLVKIRRSSYLLFHYVTIYDINQIIFSNGTIDQPCRFNVLEKCRFNVDVRFRTELSGGNLLEDCVLTIPGFHERPPLSQDRGGTLPTLWDDRNFIYNCTITRDFPAAGRVLSMADDPQKVYVLSDNLRETSILVAGPSPSGGKLWPVR